MVYDLLLLFPAANTNRNWKFAFNIETRTLFYPFVRRNLSIPVFVRACVPMADYLNNRVFFHQAENQRVQRLFLGVCSGIRRVPERIQPAHVTNADGMFIIRHAGQSRRVAMCAVFWQTPPIFNGPVQVNDEMVSNFGKSAFFVPFINVGGPDVLARPGCRTMNNDCINFVHPLFLCVPMDNTRYVRNAFSNVHRLPNQQDKQRSGPYIYVCKNGIA